MKVVTWSSNIRMTLLYVTPHYEQPKPLASMLIQSMGDLLVVSKKKNLSV
jgi:hypothetical protein